jgi:plasmid segregation protein ParM
MNVGLDVGYSAVKAVAGPDRAVSFPSVSGTPERARFSVNGAGSGDILLELPGQGTYLVGEGAITQSRFLDRREDRGWIESEGYYRLVLAAFTELSTATQADLLVVTGLPVAFYAADKDGLRDLLLRTHKAGREGRRAQSFRVTDCRVIPQPFGALLSEALDNRGKVADPQLAKGAVGVIDVGGKTTNLLSVNRLAEISRETASVSVGAWDVARAVRDHLSTACPDLDLRDHEVIRAIQARRVRYFGDPVDLGDVIDRTLEPMAEQVIAQASQLWNGAAGLDAILVAGGGALLLGPYIGRRYRHARTVADPVFANALGYWRFAQMIGG